METQNKGTAVYEDEINLYDYWKVIVKRKRFIIGLFLAAVLASAIISFLMPKIYRGEVVLKLPVLTPVLTAKEMVAIIGKIDAERIDAERILPTTHHLVADVKLNTLKDSTDKLRLIIEAKNTNDISVAMTGFVAYLNNLSLIKEPVEREKEKVAKEKEKVAKRLKDVSDLIEVHDSFAKMYGKKLKRGELSFINLVPTDIKQRAIDLDNERRSLVEEAKESMENITGVSLAGNPYISKTPVKPSIKKNIALAGIISLFAGIFLAFLMEYIERMRGKE